MELVVKFKELEDPQSNYKMHMFGKSMLELAEAYMRAGRAKEAAEMAQRCLPALIYPNKTIEEYLSYPNERPYRYGEIAKYYFYTGEASKAPGCLSQMTEYPACNFCRNKACYDRVLTDANFYEIVGKYDLALGCYNTARQMCDDDTEIDAAIAALNGQQYI
jgi:tetratricopeptide (TPR) repeat protein